MKAVFEHEKLEAYQLILQFLAWAEALGDEVRPEKHERMRHVWDHLDRMALSALYHIAQGNGKRLQPARLRAFEDSHSALSECAAALDAVVSKRGCAPDRVVEGKDLLARANASLDRLLDRFGGLDGVREPEAEYGTPANRLSADGEDAALPQ
ncbi:MAG TPA: hypothetical protein PLE19_07300 [Planctomycetota bacterium]|nr:hypothetical protein [Planctomycetota bacterium]HRR79324.1 hypothetical protein [Planctomycetota bacterium]HRT95346.1 hypothetical protein [Planctomycetota bacterium]